MTKNKNIEQNYLNIPTLWYLFFFLLINRGGDLIEYRFYPYFTAIASVSKETVISLVQILLRPIGGAFIMKGIQNQFGKNINFIEQQNQKSSRDYCLICLHKFAKHSLGEIIFGLIATGLAIYMGILVFSKDDQIIKYETQATSSQLQKLEVY